MKRNKCKSKELKDTEKYYKIEYVSIVDGLEYWHKAAGRNKLEAMDEFKKAVSIDHVKEVKEPYELT